ncbi:MAG: nuclear transport factor 2 family protein, partial [Pseudomonadota bacterium]|nr:nuclear transport factor 2 family protein [Pseudomonadota bacterium]
MNASLAFRTLAAVLAGVLAGCAGTSSTPADAPLDVALQARVAQLELRVGRLQDIGDIKRLQRAYGYYLDEGQWDHVADLFAADGTLEIGKDGVFRGRDHIRQYFRTLGKGLNGLV